MPTYQPTLGALSVGNGQTRFRVWAPKRKKVEVVLDGKHLPLERDAQGFFSGIHRAEAGAHYKYRLDGGDAFPDPCSRFQPEGPHGPSRIVDPSTFRWSDGHWKGARIKGQVIYELHVGAFSPAGNYAGIAEQ